MSRTAVQLITELSRRLGGFATAAAQNTGTQVQLVDPSLRQYFPFDIDQLNFWVYGTADVDALNVGQERRAANWAQASATVGLFAPGMPANMTVGHYELRARFQRSRLLEFLNEAVGQLSLYWYRPVADETLVTASNTWQYALPASDNWSIVSDIEIQINTSPNLVGYPFASADYLNWRARRQADPSGVESWIIDFGMLPPPGRTLRVFGEGFFPDLVADTDVLAISGKWERPAMAWIFQYAQFLANDELANRQPTGDGDKARQRALDQLERQKNSVLAMAPAHTPGKIIVPGQGDADAYPSPDDRNYLGAFTSASMR